MPRLDDLNALADAVPVLNQKAAKRAQASRLVGLQQQIGTSAPQPLNVNRAAQAAAPQQVAEQTQVALASGQQTQQQLGQIAQQGLQQEAAAAKDSLANQEITQREQISAQENAQKLAQSRADIAMRKKVTGAEQAAATRLQKMNIDQDNKLQVMTIRQREQLAKLGGDVKDKILDSRLRFERDEMGRKFSNERQLSDYNLANARTEVEFKDKLREMQQTHERKAQMLEIAERKLREMVARGFSSSEQQLDNQAKERILTMAAEMREQARREAAEAKNKAQLIQTAFTIGGAVVGSVIPGAGTAAGAMAGAAVGGGVGSLVAGSGALDKFL